MTERLQPRPAVPAPAAAARREFSGARLEVFRSTLTGVVDEIRPDGDSHWLAVSFDRSLAPYFIRKGSVAVDGVSLTVAGLGASMFDVMIIPFTWANTALSSLKVNDRVNLECDMIGKYVARSLELSVGADLKVGPYGGPK